jgi:hypothetical protein
MTLVTNMHWHNHIADATFSRGQIARSEAALTTVIGQQASRRKPNELMSYTASRSHRYQLVERLGALHISTPDAVELIEIVGVIDNLAWP